MSNKLVLHWLEGPKRAAGGRWVKEYRKSTFYYSNVAGKSDREGYGKAVEAFKEFWARIDRTVETQKTSATELEKRENYGRYSQFFLGQAPQTLAEARYARPSQALFDKAMKWLGEQFGFTTNENHKG